MLTPKEQQVYDIIVAAYDGGSIDHLDRKMLQVLVGHDMSKDHLNGLLRKLRNKGMISFMDKDIRLANAPVLQDDDCTCHNCNAIRKLCEHIRNGNTVFMYANADGFHLGNAHGYNVADPIAQDIRVYCTPVSYDHEFAKAVLSCTS